MAQNPVREELYQRWRKARATSLACTADARRLTQAATATCGRARRLQVDAIEGRESVMLARWNAGIAGFRIEGVVDGTEAEASFERGRLRCPEEVLRRAEVVVALGDTFDDPDIGSVAATLDGPVGAVLLTVVRAFSRVHVLEVFAQPALTR